MDFFIKFPDGNLTAFKCPAETTAAAVVQGIEASAAEPFQSLDEWQQKIVSHLKASE